jgi:hypothetical protein
MKGGSAENNAAFPAKAGIQVPAGPGADQWVPAFAGMTVTGR